MDDNAYVYLKTSNTFSHRQTITTSSILVSYIDITSDGQWLLVVEYYPARVKIYKNKNDLFNLFQEISPPDGQGSTHAGAITDDHQWVVFSTYSSPYSLYAYQLNGSSYELNQTISVVDDIWTQAITPDHTFMVAGEQGYYVYVYKHNGTQFNSLQNFTYSSNYIKLVSITDDHQYFMVSEVSTKIVHRYKYD